jgi:hypothetical protein
LASMALASMALSLDRQPFKIRRELRMVIVAIILKNRFCGK